MSKGNSGILSKHQAKLPYTATGVIGDVKGYEVLKEVVIRVRNSGAGPNSLFRLSGRMATDSVWEEIGEVQGSSSEIFHIASWDYILFECIAFSSVTGTTTLLTSGFFNDGMFAVNAINAMNDNVTAKLDEIEDSICKIKEEIFIINRQIEIITDHEEDEVK